MAGPQLTTHFFTSSRGSKLHYAQCGNPKGQLLICMHGLGGGSDMFTPLLPYLPASLYNITLVDFPGFGKSPFSAASPKVSVNGLVADVGELIASLTVSSGEPKKTILFGHSLGGIVALHYAAQHPDSVAGIAAFGSGRSTAKIAFVRQKMLETAASVRKEGLGPAADVAANITNFPADAVRPVKPEHRQAVRESVLSCDPEAYAQTAEAIVDPAHVDPDYSAITCPVLFVAGSDDTICPAERIKDLSKLLGGEACVQVVQSGHQTIMEETDTVAKAVSVLLGKAKA